MVTIDWKEQVGAVDAGGDDIAAQHCAVRGQRQVAKRERKGTENTAPVNVRMGRVEKEASGRAATRAIFLLK